MSKISVIVTANYKGRIDPKREEKIIRLAVTHKGCQENWGCGDDGKGQYQSMDYSFPNADDAIKFVAKGVEKRLFFI